MSSNRGLLQANSCLGQECRERMCGCLLGTRGTTQQLERLGWACISGAQPLRHTTLLRKPSGSFERPVCKQQVWPWLQGVPIRHRTEQQACTHCNHRRARRL